MNKDSPWSYIDHRKSLRDTETYAKMDTDTILVLNTNNFTEWYKQIKGLATEMEVWDFLDLEQAN